VASRQHLQWVRLSLFMTMDNYIETLFGINHNTEESTSISSSQVLKLINVCIDSRTWDRCKRYLLIFYVKIALTFRLPNGDFTNKTFFIFIFTTWYLTKETKLELQSLRCFPLGLWLSYQKKIWCVEHTIKIIFVKFLNHVTIGLSLVFYYHENHFLLVMKLVLQAET
jgi:hypothetical protein